MKELDINFYFGFGIGYYTAEDIAYDIEFSDSLYNRLRSIYESTGETYLQSILDTEELATKQFKELENKIATLREDLIEVQYDNGNHIDPDTGEEYDFSELIVDMEIVVPDEWDTEWQNRLWCLFAS